MSLPIVQIKRRNKNSALETVTEGKLNGLIEGELGYNYYDHSLWIGPYGETEGVELAELVNEDHQITGFKWTNGTTSGPQLSLFQNDSRSNVNGSWFDLTAIPSATASQSGVVTTGNQDFKGIKTFKDGIIITNSAGDSTIAKIGTNGYIEGTWLKTNSATELTTTDKLAAIKDGLIYYITPSNLIKNIKLAGAGLVQNGTVIDHAVGIQSGTISGSSGEIAYGSAINIPKITYNSTGHITNVSTTSVTIPLQTSVSGNAGSANKVNKSLIVKLNGGTTEGTNLFTFNGSTEKTVNITPSAIGINAAGTSLGLVKTGGDVTISNGTMTVNDDSHNHVISNIDNLQTKLDSKAEYIGTTISAQETIYYCKICTITIPKSYSDMYLEFDLIGRTNGRFQNVKFTGYKPNTTDVYCQILTSGHNGNYYEVKGYRHVSTSGAGDTLELWCKVPSYDTLNVIKKQLGGNGEAKAWTVWNLTKHTALPITSDTVKLINASSEKWTGNANTATTATKAQQDASGNTITTTYATKTELNTTKTNLESALNGKVPTSRTINNKALTSDITLTKADIGLGNVDNTADANKSVKYATSAGTATAANGLSCGGAYGYTTDAVGNFIAGSSAQTWNIFDKDNNTKFSVSWTTGNTNIQGTLNVRGAITGSLNGNVTGNLNGNVTGNATSANALKARTQLTTAEAMNNFLTGGEFTYTTFKLTEDFDNLGFVSNDGMLLSIPWNSGTDFGTQLAFDDSKVPNIAVRAKSTSWGTWYRLIHSGNIGSQSVNYASSAGSVAWGNITNKPGYYDSKAIKSISRSGTTFTYTCMDNTTGTFTQQDTTYGNASESSAGLMSAADKKKLNGIATNANAYTLPAAGSSLGGVKSGGDVTISGGTITVNDDSHNHIISNIDGLQSALDNKAGATTWSCVTTVNSWSRLCYISGYASYILSINQNQNSQATSTTFLINLGYGSATVQQIAASGYPANNTPKIRLVRKTYTEVYVEWLNTFGYQSATTCPVDCSAIKLSKVGSVTTYTNYTATEADATVLINLQAQINGIASSKFYGELVGNASTATKATQDGAGNIIVSTYTTKAKYDAHKHQISYTPAGTISTPSFTGSTVTSSKPNSANVTTIYSITGVGSLPSASLSAGTLPSHNYTAPSLTTSVTNRCLTFTWNPGSSSFVKGTYPTLTFNAGSLPTRSSAISMPNTEHTHSVATAGSVSQPTFTGTTATLTTGTPV